MKRIFRKFFGDTAGDILLNAVILIALLIWFAYIGIQWFGSTQYDSFFERDCYRELYTATLSPVDDESAPLSGEYICELSKIGGDYTVDWIIINDKKQDVIMEDDFWKGKATISIDPGFYDITLRENQNSSSFVFSMKAAGLTILSVMLLYMLYRETKHS